MDRQAEIRDTQKLEPTRLTMLLLLLCRSQVSQVKTHHVVYECCACKLETLTLQDTDYTKQR